MTQSSQFEKLFKEHLIVNFSEEVYGVRVYKSKYIAEIIHKELHEHKVISSNNRYILENKVNEYLKKLKIKYKHLLDKRNTAEYRKSTEDETVDAKKAIEEVENILNHTLTINDAVDWDKLKDRSDFDEPNPINQLKQKLKLIPIPYKGIISIVPPQPNEESFQPKFSFFDNIFKSLKVKKIKSAKEQIISKVSKYVISNI